MWVAEARMAQPGCSCNLDAGPGPLNPGLVLSTMTQQVWLIGAVASPLLPSPQQFTRPIAPLQLDVAPLQLAPRGKFPTQGFSGPTEPSITLASSGKME